MAEYLLSIFFLLTFAISSMVLVLWLLQHIQTVVVVNVISFTSF